MCKVVYSARTPNVDKRDASESAKKLKYLKKPRMPRFAARLSHSQHGRHLPVDRSSIRAQKKSTAVDINNKDKNRQSHQP